jgi:hypothetical protein
MLHKYQINNEENDGGTQQRCEEISFSTALAITNAAQNNEITETKNISTTLKKPHCFISYICS